MPDPNPDMPDPDRWLSDFKSRLDKIGDISTPHAASQLGSGLLGSRERLETATRMTATKEPDGSLGLTGLPVRPRIGQVAADDRGVRQYFTGYDQGGNQVWNPVGVTSKGPDDPNVTETDPLVVTARAHHDGGVGGALADTLGKSWGSINTLAGLGLGGLEYGAGLLMGAHPEVGFGNNAIQFSGSPNLLHSLLPNTFGENDAMTLGNVQIYTGNASPKVTGDAYVPGLPPIPLGKHEKAHTYQSQTLGPLYVPIWLALGGRSPNNPLERAADWYGADQGGPFSHFWAQQPPPDASH